MPRDGAKSPRRKPKQARAHDTIEVILDAAARVLAKQGYAAATTNRIAAAAGWQADFEILWDKTIVSRAEMESIIIDAGKLVGIGNGRSVGMGRFELVSFAVSE